MPVSSQAIMRTVPDTGMVDFIIVAAIWRAQNMVQEFERLPKWGEISAVPPILMSDDIPQDELRPSML